MSDCQFVIPFTASLPELVEKARKVLEGQGGEFTGNEVEGSFNISVMGNDISGAYKAIEKELHVEIRNKPMFVPCSLIESFLKKELNA